jgi:hypothetical protein
MVILEGSGCGAQRSSPAVKGPYSRYERRASGRREGVLRLRTGRQWHLHHADMRRAFFGTKVDNRFRNSARNGCVG